MGGKKILFIKPVYLTVALLVLFTVFSYFDTFEFVEGSLKDSTFQSKSKVDDRIVIIGIDDKSLKKFGKWPWSRKYHADLIKKVSQGKPAVIGIDVMFPEKSSNGDEDAAFVQAVRDAKNVVLPVTGVFMNTAKAGETKAVKLEEPFENLRDGGITAHINFFASEKDGYVRRSLNSFEYQGSTIKSFDWVISEEYMKNAGKGKLDYTPPMDSWNRSIINYAGTPGQFAHLSYSDILDDKFPSEYFKDKIVLIGVYSLGMGDAFYTSIAHNDYMYGVEIHANIIQNFLRKDFKQDAPFIVVFMLLLIFSAASFLAFRKLSPAKALMLILPFVASYMFAAKYIYKTGYVFPIIYPVTMVISIYLAMLAYRYIEELIERKRVTDVFGRYVAPQVVSKILQGGEEGLRLGGTRRDISVLFVDIRGFTPLSEKCEPEEVVGILNNYLNLCAQSIFNNQGTLDKFIGDATMAIFNAPLDLADHAFKAVKAAWDMKEGSEELQKMIMEKYGRNVQFGIGVNTGAAVVGNIGASFRMDYTAIGDTVNTAARLESNAKPGQILLSQSTYELVKDRVKVTNLGEINVKGKTQGINVFQLEGLRERHE